MLARSSARPSWIAASQSFSLPFVWDVLAVSNDSLACAETPVQFLGLSSWPLHNGTWISADPEHILADAKAVIASAWSACSRHTTQKSNMKLGIQSWRKFPQAMLIIERGLMHAAGNLSRQRDGIIMLGVIDIHAVVNDSYQGPKRAVDFKRKCQQVALKAFTLPVPAHVVWSILACRTACRPAGPALWQPRSPGLHCHCTCTIAGRPGHTRCNGQNQGRHPCRHGQGQPTGHTGMKLHPQRLGP